MLLLGGVGGASITPATIIDGITVTAGQELAFILRTASPIGYLYNPESTSGYPSGLGYRRNRAVTTGWTVNNDFGFQTFVESP